jgi:hypothetical protein
MSNTRFQARHFLAVALVGWSLVASCGGSESSEAPPPGAYVGTPGNGGLCRDSCAAPRLCDLALGCVECTSDAACPVGRPRCVRGSCQACATNADCPASAPVCYPADHQCHAACAVGSCPTVTRCDTVTGACVGCIQDFECGGMSGRPVCDPVTKQCVACASNTNCGAAAPYCWLAQGICAQCLQNSDCPTSAPICDHELRCHAGCTADTGCKAPTPYCDLPSGDCKACLGDGQCAAPSPYCVNGHCGQCRDDVQCTGLPGTPFCRNAVCVQCKEKRDCPATLPECRDGTCVAGK